jgi:hypothetical protein
MSASDFPFKFVSLVSFRSARLAGVASELVIDSGHSVHTDPRAIQEVRRILLEHAAACRRRRIATRAAPEPGHSPFRMPSA